MLDKHNYLCTATYTCRRCKKEDIASHTVELINVNKVSIQFLIAMQLNDGKRQIEFNKNLTGESCTSSYILVSQHLCDDGNLGITDMSGILIEEEP